MPMKMEQTECLHAYEDGTECSETSAYKIHTPGNCPEENIQLSKHGETLKSRMLAFSQFLHGKYRKIELWA